MKVITDRNGRYITGKTINERYKAHVLVNNIEEVVPFANDSSYEFILSTIPIEYKCFKWYIDEIDIEIKTENKLQDNFMEENNMCMTNDLINQIDESIKNTKGLLAQFKTEHRNLYDRLSNCDLKLNDLDHALENRKKLKLTAPQLVKISMKISEICTERREIKEEIERMDKAQSLIDKLNNKLTIVCVGEETKKIVQQTIERQMKSKYHPRTNIYVEIGIK